MNAPFLNNGFFGLDIGLVLAVFIGIGFGFSLQRGGFGSSRKLAAQFYLYDMTVFKVMFTAIITAMVGLFGLAKLGFLNLDAMYINPTFLWPQLAGGLLLGAGFIISGYCPGTSIVAFASGKIDGLLTIIGVTAGIFLFGVVYTPELQAFHTSGDFGRVLLSDLFGVEPTLLALIITVFAGVMFIFAEWIEGKFAGWGKLDTLPTNSPKLRYAMTMIVVVFAVIFVVPFGGSAPALQAYSPDQEVTPLQLAEMVIEKSEPITVIDVRTEEKFAEKSIPGSENVSKENVQNVNYWNDNRLQHRIYILVDENGESGNSIALPEGFRAFILKGGFNAWTKEILTEPVAPEGNNPSEMEGFKVRQAFYAYFTGAAVSAPKISAPMPQIQTTGKKKKKPSGGC